MMRIITGAARGTRLATLEGETTRPTAERTKEAIFSVLAFEIADASVLDLFAGSGQMGLEAISRGAKEAVFCDASRDAIRIIRQNAEKTHLCGSCEILQGDALSMLSRMKEKKCFDLVFLDPPYALGLVPRCLSALLANGLLSPKCKIVCETANEADVFANDAALANAFSVVRATRYGAAYVTILTPKEKDV